MSRQSTGCPLEPHLRETNEPSLGVVPVLKILLVGDSGAGKTSLIRRFVDGGEQQRRCSAASSALGVDFSSRTVELGDGATVELQVWDSVAGRGRFRRNIPSYCFRGVRGVVLVYDVTDEDSFANARRHWLGQLELHAEEGAKVILVGNKSDLATERVVSEERGRELACDIGVHFWETSAETASNVERAFLDLANEIKDGCGDDLMSNIGTAPTKLIAAPDLPRYGPFGSGCECCLVFSLCVIVSPITYVVELLARTFRRGRNDDYGLRSAENAAWAFGALGLHRKKARLIREGGLGAKRRYEVVPPKKLPFDELCNVHPEANQILEELCSALASSNAAVPVTFLEGGQSRPCDNDSSSRRMRAVPLGTFITTLESREEEYIQQEKMKDINFSNAGKRALHLLEDTVLTVIWNVMRDGDIGNAFDVHGPHLFAGPAGISVSLHFDRYRLGGGGSASTFETDPGRHNVFLQVSGRKRWTFFPPVVDPEAESATYYPVPSKEGEHWHVSRIGTLAAEAAEDPAKERALKERFPGFWRAFRRRQEIVLERGDAVHVPPRWWHTTVSLDAGVAVNWWFSCIK